MMTSVTRSCFTKQHQNCKTKTKIKTAVCRTKTKTTACKTKIKTDFLGLRPVFVLRPTVSDHITVVCISSDSNIIQCVAAAVSGVSTAVSNVQSGVTEVKTGVTELKTDNRLKNSASKFMQFIYVLVPNAVPRTE